MGKKIIPETIKVGKQEFYLTKGSSLLGRGQNKERIKEDAKYFMSQGFNVRTREIDGKHFLYVKRKGKKRKKGIVQKLMEEHDRRVGEDIPENTKESRQSHAHWGRWLCCGLCIILVIVAVCVGIYYMINPMILMV